MNIHEESWLEIEKYCKNEIEKNSKRLESREIDYNSTQYIRGELYILRKILDLPKIKEFKPTEIEDYNGNK